MTDFWADHFKNARYFRVLVRSYSWCKASTHPIVSFQLRLNLVNFWKKIVEQNRVQISAAVLQSLDLSYFVAPLYQYSTYYIYNMVPILGYLS